MKKLAILGSTGSIGRSALEIIRRHPGRFKITALAAGKNKELFRKQVEEFKPKVISLTDEKDILELKRGASYSPKVCFGNDGLLEVAAYSGADMVVSALVGASGLAPTLAAIRARKDIALANKEVLVMAGQLVMEEVVKNKINLLPIDSEHSAIFQSLVGHKRDDIKRLILTASGGPFLNLPLKKLSGITPKQALNHPKWKMGKKVTIDSATLMNKGLEVIEAMWLFDMPPEKINVHIHPQSIVHSMVEYVDGSIVAQLGPTDMKGPISYALSYPDKRVDCGVAPLNLCKMDNLTFIEPDTKRFPALRLAYEAMEAGGLMPAVLNAADEVAVEAFLERKIKFTNIPKIVEATMVKLNNPKPKTQNPKLNQILEADRWAREAAKEIITAVKAK
ncbi:MAG: 1-deoxy-D-xylulose-5-phosphate reductoisomerase [Deltaproteobacteria bacterium]|nr:1-deoxy-D-xylulose-5-phosphate reductoisomerase [Deltaproteobacteria bacterium]